MERGGLTFPIATVAVGAGNVASQLLPALASAGVVGLVGVWSRTLSHARELAAACGVAAECATDNLDSLPCGDMYIASVADDLLPQLPAHVGRNGALWVHTSGSVDASVLAPLSSDYGVMYPLQTFSRGVAVDISATPFFIEGSTPEVAQMLTVIAEMISWRVYPADSARRGRMHAAAVFACNFANHLWAHADDILRRDASLSLEVLEPLLRETLRKALLVGPREAQTGPARRGDSGVIAKHCALLPEHQATLYRTLTDSIIDYYRTSYDDKQ